MLRRAVIEQAEQPGAHMLQVLIVFLSLTGTAAFAGPDSTARRFLDDTVSMMDWGLIRAEQWLNSGGRNVQGFYEWDSNRLVFSEASFRAHLPGDVEEECKEWVRAIRAESHVVPDKGTLAADSLEHSRIAGFFRHTGFSRRIDGQEDREAVAALDNLIELRRVYWIARGDGSYSEHDRCEGMLRAGAISFTQP